ncbi:hypothetical protein [Paenibacillus polymyxa]|uniref:hypothetical protein n=1 Tax=Paenibacillus polymyxa TaxID=1406 RepID=UPI000472A197|nr:hypothetical protein [Paenibacillus polymyxa]
MASLPAMKTKLVIVEGIPGSGKSTLSRYIHDMLNTHQIESELTILECCFLQNPGCALLARHDAGEDRFIQHVSRIAEQIQELNPILFYLKQPNVRETIERVKTMRSQEWLDFAIWYHTGQDYGKNKGLHGYEGYIQFLEHRRELELQIIEQLPFQSFIMDNSDYDWENQQQTVSNIMMKYL